MTVGSLLVAAAWSTLPPSSWLRTTSSRGILSKSQRVQCSWKEASMTMELPSVSNILGSLPLLSHSSSASSRLRPCDMSVDMANVPPASNSSLPQRRKTAKTVSSDASLVALKSTSSLPSIPMSFHAFFGSCRANISCCSAPAYDMAALTGVRPSKTAVCASRGAASSNTRNIAGSMLTISLFNAPPPPATSWSTVLPVLSLSRNTVGR
mmetsp:Transcript_7981/g.33593  ORF Transcript_7981/g.33593 Transcript_7981/m.33593 type:complete len:209 (+) Transcript_7981:446-1072(+)